MFNIYEKKKNRELFSKNECPNSAIETCNKISVYIFPNILFFF